MGVMNPMASVEGTATATGTTAVAFPGAQPHQQYGLNFVLCNMGTVWIYFKKSDLATGPDAADNTTGGFRHAVAPGSMCNYLRSPNEKYIYLVAASATAAYSISVGDGE